MFEKGRDDSGDEIGTGRSGRLLISIIRAYRRIISPHLPPSCIYTPTCSEYAEIAIRRFGACRGSWLALKRILRCHPFRKGGYDPVPDRQCEDKELSGRDNS
jgi:uncharacterized protein